MSTYMKILRICFIVFMLCFSFQINAETKMDGQGITVYHPQELIGKTIVFPKQCEKYIANCFFDEYAIENGKYTKRHIFAVNQNGETPECEYMDRTFKVQDVLFTNSKQDYTKGFVLKLQRDDDVIMGLKFNRYEPTKQYKVKSIPSFSDLFIISKEHKYYHPINYFISFDGYATDISVSVFDIDSLYVGIEKITRNHTDRDYPVSFLKQVRNYTLDSLALKSEGVRVYLTDDERNHYCLNPHQFSEIAVNRESDINFNKTMSSWVEKYNQEELMYIKERLVGKEVWINRRVSKYDWFETSNDNRVFYDTKELYKSTYYDGVWINRASDIYGSGVTRFESMFLNVMNSYQAISCVIEDMVVLENCLLPRQRNHKNVKGTLADNDFCVYLVIKQNPNKEYSISDEDSRIYMMVEDGISEIFVSDIENEILISQCRSRDVEMNNQMNQLSNTIYKISMDMWGESTAELIRQGDVRFGFSPEMCIMAYYGSPYQISKMMTKLGTAICYNFYEKEVKLYFIDQQLIGIQFRLEDIKYYIDML